MDKQPKRQLDLSFIDKLALKNGSLVFTLFLVLAPLYARFVMLEDRLKGLQKSVENLTAVTSALREELSSEKATTSVLTLRLSYLEKSSTKPGLFK